MKKRILLTGASGNMGIEAVKQFAESDMDIHLRLFALPNEKDKKILQPYVQEGRIEIFYGDIRNREEVNEAVKDRDIVLHIAALISPQADHNPRLAWEINYFGAKNVIDSILERPDRDEVKLITIGSVAMTGNRVPPYHFGRIGDPLEPSAFDYYAVSKIAAERYLIESNLKHWVSLRQTGIMHENLFEVNDGIGYHVPLNNYMEWVTARDSGRLLVNVCRDEVPDHFWKNVYNIGGGKDNRWFGIDFLTRMYGLLDVNLRNFEKPNYYAFRNFHGHFYYDSDKLEELVPFRSETVDDVMDRISQKLPFKMKLLKYIPNWLLKIIMRKIALNGETPLNWVKTDNQQKIKAFLVSKDKWENFPDWQNLDLEKEQPHEKLNHGYDENKNFEELDIEDMQQAAVFRGGSCLSEEMEKGNIYTPLKWKCAENHTFSGSPFLILKAGHWCPHCVVAPWNFDHQAKDNKFLAQVWYADHSKDEDNIYSKAIEEL